MARLPENATIYERTFVHVKKGGVRRRVASRFAQTVIVSVAVTVTIHITMTFHMTMTIPLAMIEGDGHGHGHGHVDGDEDEKMTMDSVTARKQARASLRLALAPAECVDCAFGAALTSRRACWHRRLLQAGERRRRCHTLLLYPSRGSSLIRRRARCLPPFTRHKEARDDDVLNEP